MSNQGLRQASARSIYGGTADVPYAEDFLRMFTFEGVPDAGTFDERFLQWLNIRLSASYTNLPEAQTAFAISLGLSSWNEVGTFAGAAPSGPVNDVAPVVSGTPNVGQTLSCTTGTWTGTGTITYAYQWQRDGVNIGSATASTYLLVGADAGTTVRCRVTATDDIGSTGANSNGLAVTYAVPVNTVAPVASGTAEVGETLSCTTGTWTGSPTITYTYQWRADEVNISGATASTFELTEDELGALVDCAVTATNPGGSASEDSNDLGPVTEPSDALIDYLIVAGGGGFGPTVLGELGAQPGYGGAGGLLQGTGVAAPAIGSYSVTVGAGGAINTNGSNSSFNSLTAIGGGRGGSDEPGNGASGGSGGGGGDNVNIPAVGTGGAGTSGQGFAGGSGVSASGGGGGGGAGGAASGTTGGAGVASSISGSSLTYARGGSNAITPVANRGDGSNTAAGTSGVVIIRYLTGTITATGGTVTTSGGYTIHTFTSSGTWERTA